MSANEVSSSLENMPVIPMLILAGLFVVVSNQQTYEMVAGVINNVLPDVQLVDDEGQPTLLGQSLHGLVLSIIVYVLNTVVLTDPSMKILS